MTYDDFYLPDRSDPDPTEGHWDLVTEGLILQRSERIALWAGLWAFVLCGIALAGSEMAAAWVLMVVGFVGGAFLGAWRHDRLVDAHAFWAYVEHEPYRPGGDAA